MTWTIFGDLHGYWNEYEQTLKMLGPQAKVVQVGDMGIGFGLDSTAAVFDDKFAEYQNMRFIRGNHDNPQEVKNSSHYIEDGTVEDGVMFIGGANSIDRQWRTEGLDWWADEELSIAELQQMIDKYIEVKPRVMITHDTTETAFDQFEGMLAIPCRTRQAFETMWQAHKPEMWLFGHYHINFDRVIEGTRFVCINQYTAHRYDI